MISFHWLLVIIAGGAIFILFSLFINTGKQASESSLSVDVLLHFDTIFSSLVTTEKTEATLPSRQEIELEFSCRLTDQTTDSAFVVSGGARKDLDNIILFSKEIVSGDEIFTVARNLAIPYSVSSLLYVSDPSVLYVIEAVNPAARNAIQSLLPREATIIRVGEDGIRFINDIDFDDYDDIVVITQTSSGGSPNSLTAIRTMTAKSRVNIYLYHIQSTSDDFISAGKVQGYTIENARSGLTPTVDGEQLSYEADEFLAGILMSENSEWFRCVEQKLFDKLARVSRVLAERANILYDDYANKNSICRTTYGLARTELYAVSENPRDYEGSITTIKSYNSRLELQSCPLLY